MFSVVSSYDLYRCLVSRGHVTDMDVQCIEFTCLMFLVHMTDMDVVSCLRSHIETGV